MDSTQKRHFGYLAKVMGVLALSSVGSSAWAGEKTALNDALSEAFKDQAQTQVRLNLNDESHRQFRVEEVERNERIVVDPNLDKLED